MEDIFYSMSITAIIFTFVIPLLISFGLACIPASIAKQKGYDFWLWWLYGWLLFIVAIIHITAFMPDKNNQNQSNNTNNIKQNNFYDNEKNNVEELKKYKELLDQGVITQEEFETQKKQLLDFK